VTALPGLLLPGRSVAAVVRVAVPTESGEYHVAIQVRRPGSPELDFRPIPGVGLSVTDDTVPIAPPAVPTNLEPSLRAAHAAHRLPDGYADVSDGRLGRIKRWVKRKLLHNFQTAYVDVLSRQQSAFNRQVLTAIAELGDGQAALAHAALTQSPVTVPDADDLRAELRRLRGQCRALRRRLAQLESAQPPALTFPEEAAA
jgi:hypothetical protein